MGNDRTFQTRRSVDAVCNLLFCELRILAERKRALTVKVNALFSHMFDGGHSCFSSFWLYYIMDIVYCKIYIKSYLQYFIGIIKN